MVERISFHDEIRRNKIKSFILMIIIFIVFVLVGALIALALDPSLFFVITILATVLSIVYIIASYYNAEKIAIASVGAKPASPTEHRMFLHAVESMSIASGLPMPKAYVMESEQINAFASGRDPQHAVICVTTGAIRKLDKQELEGVVAHEMAHVANFDVRFMTFAAIMVGLISITAQIFLRSLWFSGDRDKGRAGAIILIAAIVAAILAPILAQLVSLAISRKREYAADATGVKFTRYSPGLKRALEKIKNEHVSEKDKKHYPTAVAPLFMSDPFKRKVQGLFSTHPPIEDRISKLARM